MSLSFLKIDFPRTAEDSILDFSDYNFLNLVVWFLSAICIMFCLGYFIYA